jgi:predicted porin
MDPSQNDNDGLDDGTLLEAHVDYQRGNFGLRTMYARWDFSGDAVEEAGADEQSGWYIEPSYKLTKKLGFYTRYEDIEAARNQDKFTQWEVGFNYWPVENVVLKFDYRDRSHDLDGEYGRDFTGFDLGVGYSF